MSFPRSHYSGFPFNAESDRDEFPFNRNRQGSLKSTLDDIAKRHPELAEHFQNLNQGPKPRNRPTEEFKAKFRRPFGEHFPFDDDFDIDKKFAQKFCEPREFYDPQGHFPQTSSYQGENNTHSQQNPTEAAAPQHSQPENNSPASQSTQIPEKEKISIQQSNTVDLGQKQEPIDDRNQRSMSAPPGETQKRYTSSINIPVNTPSENMSHNQQQHQEPKSNERIIPIQVEGRDIPVIPKNIHIPPTHSHQMPQRHDHFSRAGFPDEHFSQKFPHNFQQQHPKDEIPIPVQREKPAAEQHQQQAPPQQTAPQSQKVETQEPKVPPPERKRVSPIEQIQEIQKDVSNLMEQVEKFTGKSKDKQYLYLDEMLTRNLIKLDNIDTQGQENIRLSRKEAIKCIQQAISLLESRASLDSEEKMNVDENSQAVAEEKQQVVPNNPDNGISTKPEDTSNSNGQQIPESQPSTDIEKMEITENNTTEPNQTTDSKEENCEPTNQETRAVLVNPKDDNVHENKDVVDPSNQDTVEKQKNEECKKGEKKTCSPH
ncbi:BAG domain-containing protein Samui [Diorhabda carinulata]|uniref:BAG domain-containing protein Samui n=1 Tax=Diorhabda carinulata TaxID=1163345 RepID=UPI0025A07659|nr:BAG domain-containing protein Samui [Diorhabda carinulata]